jgi:heme exporter protein B
MSTSRDMAMFWTIFHKELRVEWRSREVWFNGLFFALLLATLFMFGFYRDQTTAWQAGPGALWVSLVFLSNTAFGRTFSRERESGCLAALRLVPGIHGPLFWAKWASTMFTMVLLEILLVPLLSMTFHMPLLTIGPSLLLPLLLATAGMCALGTVLSAALASFRLKEVLLPLVLFPLLIPLLVAGVKATGAVLEDNFPELWDWVRLLVAFDVIFVVLSRALFRSVLEASD